MPIRPPGVEARNEPLIARCPAHDRCAVANNPDELSRGAPPVAVALGLVFSLGDLFENQLVDGEIRNGCLAAYRVLESMGHVEPNERFFPSCQYGDGRTATRAHGARCASPGHD